MLGLFKNLFGTAGNAELQEAIKKGAFLVDVRTPGEFSSGSAKGAVNIPLDRISAQLGKFKGKKDIVVFCRSGNRSSRAKSILEKSGVQHVVNGGSLQNVKSVINK